MTLSRDNISLDQTTEDSWDGTIKDIVPITGSKQIVYILWGEAPESPEFAKYGFKTEAEARAFMCGIDLMDGWMGWMGAYSAETFGKGDAYDTMTEEEFAQEIQGTHDFEEESN